MTNLRAFFLLYYYFRDNFSCRDLNHDDQFWSFSAVSYFRGEKVRNVDQSSRRCFTTSSLPACLPSALWRQLNFTSDHWTLICRVAVGQWDQFRRKSRWHTQNSCTHEMCCTALLNIFSLTSLHSIPIRLSSSLSLSLSFYVFIFLWINSIFTKLGFEVSSSTRR